MSIKSLSPKWLGSCVAGVSVAVAAIACGEGPEQLTGAVNEDPAIEMPKVVVTTGVLCDLTQQVAQDTVDLTCLLQPGQDPHTYQAKPSDRQAIDAADLLLYGGYDFEPSIIGLVDASENTAPKVAVYEAAVPDPLMGKGHSHDHGDDHANDEAHDHAHDEAHDEAHDHAHDEAHDHAHDEAGETAAALVPDPHIWHSARNNGAIVEVIADSLVQLNPDQADIYQANATQLTERFTTLDDWIRTQVASIPEPNRKLVTTHDAFRYFSKDYDIAVEGALGGLTTDERPSGKRLTDLVDQVKAAQVPAIFAESTTNPELINAIAQDANVKVADQPLFVEGPGTADSQAPTTQTMLVVNTCTIVNALGGSCDADQAPL